MERKEAQATNIGAGYMYKRKDHPQATFFHPDFVNQSTHTRSMCITLRICTGGEGGFQETCPSPFMSQVMRSQGH